MGTDLYLKLLIIDTLVDIWHQKKKKKNQEWIFIIWNNSKLSFTNYKYYIIIPWNMTVKKSISRGFSFPLIEMI